MTLSANAPVSVPLAVTRADGRTSVSTPMANDPKVASLPTRPSKSLGSEPPHAITGQYSVLSPVVNPALLAFHAPVCRQAEALRGLRSQLVLRWFSQKNSALAVMAPSAGQGCSTLAANLAITLAQLGEPTLLIDANFRQPRQHELFGLTPEAGLSDLLQGRVENDDALIPVAAVENLHVLCAGALLANPQDQLSRGAFSDLVRTDMPELFRAIIIDTPPALDYADAQVIAARAQGCLLLTTRHRTSVADVERVKETLLPTGARLLGAVLNG